VYIYQPCTATEFSYPGSSQGLLVIARWLYYYWRDLRISHRDNGQDSHVLNYYEMPAVKDLPTFRRVVPDSTRGKKLVKITEVRRSVRASGFVYFADVFVFLDCTKCK